MWNTTIEAEEPANISSYQMLGEEMDKLLTPSTKLVLKVVAYLQP